MNRYHIKMPDADYKRRYQWCHNGGETVVSGGLHTAMITVGVDSPKTARRAVWLCAQYFRREFGYDVVQYGYEGNESDRSAIAYLWVDTHLDAVIGACCFRKCDETNRYRLCWVWLHPYCRGKGILSGSWSHFRGRFGDFHIETPLSRAMQGFVNKNLTEAWK